MCLPGTGPTPAVSPLCCATISRSFRPWVSRSQDACPWHRYYHRLQHRLNGISYLFQYPYLINPASSPARTQRAADRSFNPGGQPRVVHISCSFTRPSPHVDNAMFVVVMSRMRKVVGKQVRLRCGVITMTSRSPASSGGRGRYEHVDNGRIPREPPSFSSPPDFRRVFSLRFTHPLGRSIALVWLMRGFRDRTGFTYCNCDCDCDDFFQHGFSPDYLSARLGWCPTSSGGKCAVSPGARGCDRPPLQV